MRIKYMGNADVRRLEKGEDFGGRLGEPLDRDIEWNWDNRHVIDTDAFDGVDEEFWSMLLDEPDFKNVTDLKRVPTNEAQQTWRSMPKTEESPEGRAVSGSSSSSDAEGASSTDAELASASAGSTEGASASSAPARRSR